MQARIARPRLADRLNRALDAGHVLLVAGAGFGKTIALEEALEPRGARSVWVRCRPGDHDAGRVLRRLLDGLSDVAPGAADLVAERLATAQERVDIRAMGTDLVDELNRLLVDQVVIVFDDAENVAASPHAATLLGDLLEADARGFRIAVASRTPLPLHLAKLRSTGRLSELGAGDLAFSPDECAELLALVNGAPPEGEPDWLFSGTEGWPLGASLGALHAGTRAWRGTASHAELFGFLREEVLDRIPAPQRGLVLDSSVPRELDHACSEALGLPEDFADRVARAGLPLRQVEPGQPLFAYHPLVREFLLERLEAERTPDAKRDLHGRVAPALAAAGRMDEAIEHWLAAELWAEALGAITATGPALLHSAPDTLQRRLERLPGDLRATPWCLLLQGALDWSSGHQARAVDGLRRALDGFTEASDVPGIWLARFSLADPLFVTGGLEEVVALAEDFDAEPALAAGIAPPAVAVYSAAALGALGRARECEALSRRLVAHPHSGPIRSAAVIAECYRLLLAGDFEELVRGAEAAIREFERFDPVNRLPVIAGILPLALGDQGRDAEALAGWERVEEIARAAHSSAMLKVSLVWRALLHARTGSLPAARDCLAQAGAGTEVGWREYAAELARAKVASLSGDSAAAVSACQAALALAEQAPLPDRFQAAVEAAPVLFEAGLPAQSRSLVGEALALCDERVPGEEGRYSRGLLLGLRAWLSDTEGDTAGSIDALRRIWDGCGPVAAHVVRREWALLEMPLWKALDSAAIDAGAVIGAIEAAWPGGGALLPFTGHPAAQVRRAAITPAAISGHPDLLPRLGELAGDPDPEVAAAAAAARERIARHPPPLSFTLLGGFGVRRGGWQAQDAAWDRRVAQRLVRYLLVTRGSLVPDDLLLEAFWPGIPVESARNRLKVAVSCARAVLDVPGAPSVIEVSERTLALRLRERDSVDIDLFEAAAATGLRADGDERRPLLERAAALWTGEPLPEERYADWAAVWRDRLIMRYAQVLSALTAACHAESDHPAATQAARRLVELDPLDEAAQRQLMTAYSRSGRRAHALRQYLECRRALVDELGVEPASETTEVQRRVLAGEPV